MRRSRAITLTVLSGLTLTAGLTASGCGKKAAPTPSAGEQYEPADRTWYDSEGNPVPERWRADEHGHHVLDDQGRPIPAPAVPYDRYGRLWVFTNGLWGPLPVPRGRPPARVVTPRSGAWLTGGSGYRTTGTTPMYRAPTGFGSAPVRGPSGGPPAARSGFGTSGAVFSSGSS